MNYLNMQNENILPIAKELNQLLADYHVYYQKLRNFHWNIVGKISLSYMKNLKKCTLTQEVRLMKLQNVF